MRSAALFAVILSIALCVSAFSAIRAEAAESWDAPYTRATPFSGATGGSSSPSTEAA